MPELASAYVWPRPGPVLSATYVRMRIERPGTVQWMGVVLRMYVFLGSMCSRLLTPAIRVHFPSMRPWRTTVAGAVRRTGLQNRPKA